jgi:polysulfide reductase chain C
MDVIWGNTAQYDRIVWGWLIAVYLFIAGLSAGALLASIFARGNSKRSDGFVKAGAIIAPVFIAIGLVLLIFDLSKPFSFYLLMFYYQLTSVMSIGVILLVAYSIAAKLYSMMVLKDELLNFNISKNLIKPFLPFIEKIDGKAFRYICIALAVSVGSYTGFLLSAMVAKPLLNNAVLPLLFLLSGLSAGVAATIFVGLTCFKKDVSTENLHYLHSLDSKSITGEIFVLFLMFMGLHYHGGVYAKAASQALTTGVWAAVFWVGVVGLGLIAPLILAAISAGPEPKYETSACEVAAASEAMPALNINMILFSAAIVMAGSLLLRVYLLYAGQIFTG